MNNLHAATASHITEQRIAGAERARAARHVARARRAGRTSSPRRVLQPIAHPGLALARLWRPE